VNIWVPSKLNAKEKELLKQLASSEHMAPNEEERKNIDRSFFEKVKDVFS